MSIPTQRFPRILGSVSLVNENSLDQFYTNSDVVDICLATLDMDSYSLAIEPSAGDGAFLKKIKIPKIGLDLEPKARGILEGDYISAGRFAGALTRALSLRDKLGNEKILVVGNPPFGKNSSLAVKFFNYSAEYCDAIAFIVPKTFKKVSVQNRLNLQFHLAQELSLPADSFRTAVAKPRAPFQVYYPGYDETKDVVYVEEAYDVPCVWQVWERRETPREVVKAQTTHEDFKFLNVRVDKETGEVLTDLTKANFAVQRVGGNAGNVYEDFAGRSWKSHHLIIGPAWVREIMKSLKWGKDSAKYNTAGNPSISKAELIKAYVKRKNFLTS